MARPGNKPKQASRPEVVGDYWEEQVADSDYEHADEQDPLGRYALAGEDPPPVRRVYAATRIVMSAEYHASSHTPDRPAAPEEILAQVNWEATAGLRRRLDALGFGVAEAMDTAQRNQVGWPVAERLIRECGALELAHGFVAGAGVDHLDGDCSQTELVEGVVHQARFIQRCGGVPILLPLAWLTRERAGADQYVEVYRAIVEQLDGPLLVHWLGPMFAAELEGYFPGDSFLAVMALDPEKLRGAKLSLLDADLERRVRRELGKRDQVVLTGDDLNFVDLIGGEVGETRTGLDFDGRPLSLGEFSHALLGVFDGIAEPASLALRHLARGDRAGYRAILEPCQEFGRHVFQTPTRHYKAGLAFVSWLSGLQDNPLLANHEECTRDSQHLLRAAELAARSGAIANRELARSRLQSFLVGDVL